jgi:GTPase SAR1 family protein
LGNLFIVGTAGSGKTVLTAALRRYLLSQDISVTTVNLDPAVKFLPYTVDIDVRDWVDIDEVVEEYSLGPNGSMIVGVDLVAQNMDEIYEEIDDYQADAVLIDTPGQLEVFVYRRSGIEIVKQFSPNDTLTLFLMDATLCKKAVNYISLVLLSSSTQLQLGTPMVYALTKKDLLEPHEVDIITQWSDDFNNVLDSMLDDQYTLQTELTTVLIDAVRNLQTNLPIIPVSGLSGEGIIDVAAFISRIWKAGDDWKI